MIKVRVYQVNGNRLAKLRRELGYLTAADFFKRIPLAEERREVEEKLEEESPKGGEISETKAWLAERGLRKLQPRFRTGWRVKRSVSGTQLSWQISHLLLSSRNSSHRAKFLSIEYGSKRSAWAPNKQFHFKSAQGQWYSFADGHPIVHQANPAANVIKKTSEFIQLVMIPALNDKIKRIVDRRLSQNT